MQDGHNGTRAKAGGKLSTVQYSTLLCLDRYRIHVASQAPGHVPSEPSKVPCHETHLDYCCSSSTMIDITIALQNRINRHSGCFRTRFIIPVKLRSERGRGILLWRNPDNCSMSGSWLMQLMGFSTSQRPYLRAVEPSVQYKQVANLDCHAGTVNI